MLKYWWSWNTVQEQRKRKVGRTKVALQSFSFTGESFFPQHYSCIGEDNGIPLQYSCLENPMDGGAWCATVHGVSKSQTRLNSFIFTFHFSCIGEGNGNPLQCSCLENPRDGGAWWAAVYGVAQSRTRLKQLSSKTLYNSSESNSITKNVFCKYIFLRWELIF